MHTRHELYLTRQNILSAKIMRLRLRFEAFCCFAKLLLDLLKTGCLAHCFCEIRFKLTRFLDRVVIYQIDKVIDVFVVALRHPTFQEVSERAGSIPISNRCKELCLIKSDSSVFSGKGCAAC